MDNNGINLDRSALLKRIQEMDFALYETVLYLDGHPNSQKALEHYRAHRDALKALKEEYSRRFGPLTIYDNHDNDSWQWVDKPWPWEKEGN
jgi:spore coat protein JB